MKATTAIILGAGALTLHLWLKEQRKKEPTINIVDKLPLGLNYNAIALPPAGIYIRKEHTGNERLIKHELQHWRQYQRMGLIPYYLNYGIVYAMKGYDHHPMEIEARLAAGESGECLLNYTACIRNGTAKTAHNPNFRI